MYPLTFPAGAAVRITGTMCFQSCALLKRVTGEISCPVFPTECPDQISKTSGHIGKPVNFSRYTVLTNRGL